MKPHLAAAGGLLALGACYGSSPSHPPGRVADRVAGASNPVADTAEIRQRWIQYLESKGSRHLPRVDVPSPYWLSAEQERWPHYFDLASGYLDYDSRADSIAIVPAGADGSVYEVRTRYRSPTTHRGSSSNWWTELTLTVFAVRTPGGWAFANALPRLTDGWSTATVGPITYVVDPKLQFNRARAERAVAFADSVAAIFDVPRLDSTTYYVVSSLSELFRILGLVSKLPVDSFGGGLAQPSTRTIFSGTPRLGEEYRHEIVHAVMGRVAQNSLYAVSEGVATWLGGTDGESLDSARRNLASLLQSRPDLTLDSLLIGDWHAPHMYAGAAVLVDMVHERGGIAAVRRLYEVEPELDRLREHVARFTGTPWDEVQRVWRTRVLSGLQQNR